MRGALVILIAMVVIGVILFITDVIFYRRRGQGDTVDSGTPVAREEDLYKEEKNETVNHGEFCCGKHLVCEKTSLTPLTDEIVYYDDEELDRFRGRESESYTISEEEEFRDVMLTLLPEDVPGWARSITQREINLPTNIREELLMIVNELRGVS